jgi:hypothetical protein
VMGIMFDRLYTLRNQLLHGGSNIREPVFKLNSYEGGQN